MIRFIDIDNNVIIDAGGSYIEYVQGNEQRTDTGGKYVFQIGDNGCSVGKWYSKPIVFVSESTNVRLSFPEDSHFHFIDTSIEDNEVVEGHKYKYTLNDRLVQTIELNPTYTDIGRYVESGSESTVSLYSTNILYMSDIEGYVTDEFLVEVWGISDYVPFAKFKVGADTYTEDERLKIDLSNEGVEIPDGFQRAVNGTNVHDDSQDSIVLNQKWKELLVEYWNVVANKGSYSSLVNSLKFFGYGDIARIEEYWKQTDLFGNEELIGRDIEQTLDPMIRSYLDTMVKTTYIGIYLAVNGTVSEGGHVKYIDIPEFNKVAYDGLIPEPVPEMTSFALDSTLEDLVLKMTLVGNYFSTYFMPIHLDLINSCVEKTVFTNTVKILKNMSMNRMWFFDNVSPIKCSLSTENQYWIQNTTAFNYPDTVLRYDTLPVYWGDGTTVGMDQYVEDNISSSDGIGNIKKFLNQYFNGVGCLVPVDAVISSSMFAKSISVSIYRQTEGPNYSMCKKYTSDEPVYGPEISFNLLFTESGRYLVEMQVSLPDSTDFAGSWYVDIHGPSGNSITIDRISKIDYRDDQELFDDWFYKNDDINQFMFTQPFAEQIHYKQWLSTTDGSETEGIGLNHTVVIDCGPNGERPLKMRCNGNLRSFSFSRQSTVSELELAYPHYWWKLLERKVAVRSNRSVKDSGEYRFYIVGVRKFFDTVCDNVRLVEETYKNSDGEAIGTVIVDYSMSKGSRYRGFVTVTAPVGSAIAVDLTEIVTDSTVTTIPVTKRISEISVKYLEGGHMFVKKVKVPDMNSSKGTDDWKVVPEKARGYTTVDQSRFFPLFHRIEPVEGFTVNRSDTLVCIPNFRFVDRVENCYWEFTNRTTGETISSKSFGNEGRNKLYIQQPFIGRYDYSGELSKGYYNVSLHYSMGGEDRVETVDSAFVVS